MGNWFDGNWFSAGFPQLSRATTPGAIRDRMLTVIEALVPMSLSGTPFRRYRNEGGANFRQWAHANAATAAWRRVQVRDTGEDEPPAISNVLTEQRFVAFELVVAYPQNQRAGRDAALDRDDLMREDQLQLEATVGMVGRANFSTPYPDACWVDGSTSRELGDGVDFLVIRQKMMYLLQR